MNRRIVFVLLLVVCMTSVSVASQLARIRRGDFFWNPLGISVPTAQGPVGVNPNLGVNWQPKTCVSTFFITEFYFDLLQLTTIIIMENLRVIFIFSGAQPASGGFNWNPLGIFFPTKNGEGAIDPSIGVQT
jgi:hypothetical protein